MEAKHTPGPWSYWSGYNSFDKIEAQVTADDGDIVIASYNHLIADGEANAKLMAAAPVLLAALKSAADNEEQRVFEAWLQRTTPSGDCDLVHSQWLESSDYEDFCSAWEKQLSAITKATA